MQYAAVRPVSQSGKGKEKEKKKNSLKKPTELILVFHMLCVIVWN